MEIKATAKTLRIPPRKARLVLDIVRGKDVEEAAAILKFTPNFAADAIGKILKSAVSNATNNHGLDVNVDNLFVEECFANKGPTMKRIKPRAQGRAYRIEKRMSHITIVLNER